MGDIILCGALHGGHTQNLLTGEKRPIDAHPSRDFYEFLQENLPPGARVGIESLTDKDFVDIQEHLKQAGAAAGFHDCKYLDTSYWHDILAFLRHNGHTPVYLEDKEEWMRYNQADIDYHRIERKDLIHHSHESEHAYHLKLCDHNDRSYRQDAIARGIHTFDRDEAMLRNIRHAGLHAAIVGKGHSNDWMNAPETLQRHGIGVKKYVVDDADIEGTHFHQYFCEHAQVDPALAFETASLRRTLHLINHGTIVSSDGQPTFPWHEQHGARQADFVGCWDYVEPTRGYFEMFIDKNNDGRITGTIEDLLGLARFDGTLTKDKLDFDKRYIVGACAAGVLPGPIHYEAARHGDVWVGKHDIGHCVLMQEPKATPMRLITCWADVTLPTTAKKETSHRSTKATRKAARKASWLKLENDMPRPQSIYDEMEDDF